MFCLGVFETTDHLFPAEPLELFRVNDNIGRVSTAGKLATTRAMAVLEDEFRALKLVADGPAQAATPGGFTHIFLPPIRCSLVHYSIAQQIRGQQADNFAQSFIDHVLFKNIPVGYFETTRTDGEETTVGFDIDKLD
jgi:hypothetical protein